MPWSEVRKAIDSVEPFYPHIAAVFTVMLATIKLWWYDRNQTRKLINDNHTVLIKEIRELSTANQKQHSDLTRSLVDQMIALNKR